MKLGCPLTWMRSSWDMSVCVSRQLETIFSGNRECWGTKESGVRNLVSSLGIVVSYCPELPTPHTHWGALEQFILGEVLPEDKAAVSANGPGSLHFYHRLMVLQAPLWDQG